MHVCLKSSSIGVRPVCLESGALMSGPQFPVSVCNQVQSLLPWFILSNSCLPEFHSLRKQFSWSHSSLMFFLWLSRSPSGSRSQQRGSLRTPSLRWPRLRRRSLHRPGFHPHTLLDRRSFWPSAKFSPSVPAFNSNTDIMCSILYNLIGFQIFFWIFLHYIIYLHSNIKSGESGLLLWIETNASGIDSSVLTNTVRHLARCCHPIKVRIDCPKSSNGADVLMLLLDQ